MKECFSVLEGKLNELSSTTLDDAGEQAEKYFNTKLAKKFRDAAEEARQREKETEYEKTLQILDDIEVNGKQFYVARYVPTNIKVLIYLNKVNQCAIARIKNNELINIKQKDILSDIAHIFNNREAIGADSVKSISKAIKQSADDSNHVESISRSIQQGRDLEPEDMAHVENIKKSRQLVKDIVARINAAAGSNISWRYFMGNKTNNITGTRDAYYIKKDFGTVEGEYQYAVYQYDSKSEYYSIYYIMIGTKDFSFMMHVETKEQSTDIEGAQIITTPYRVMRSQGACDKCPVPTTESSDIAAIYEFFMNNKKIGQTLINIINSSLDFSYMSLNDIQKAYDRKYKQNEVSDKAEFVNSENGEDITDDQMNDFM